MVILLPHSNSNLEELESAISKVPDMDELLKFPRPGRSKVEVSLPKFKLESEIDLNDNLKAMGMVEMFDENKADFSGMTGGVNKNLYVSKVRFHSVGISWFSTTRILCKANFGYFEALKSAILESFKS